MKIAVIPARGGSKRIPKKNIKYFCGKPMIAWSIEVAKQSKLFDHVIVSTDDQEIAAIARSYGATVPFIRPSDLSNDYAGTTEVIAHATQWALDQSWDVSAVCCVYATAPFVQIQDLKQGLINLETGGWQYSFSVTEYASPIYRSFQTDTKGGLKMLFPEYFASRSQDLPHILHDAGQFYWGKPSAWIKQKKIFSKISAPVIIPSWRVQDIDNQSDWVRAEFIFKQIKESNL